MHPIQQPNSLVVVAAWTGGQPNVTWNGLAPGAPLQYQSPNQLRPQSTGSAQKSYNHRKTGRTEKFKAASDLSEFKDAVEQHLIDTGMDTIAYLIDPQNAATTISIITNHSRFTMETARTASNLLSTNHYDMYDKMNSKVAKESLFDSLDHDLVTLVKQRSLPEDTFCTVWMQFLHQVQPISMERYEDVKHRTKTRLPSRYPGQNITKLSSDFMTDARELTAAGVYDDNLTLSMLSIFLMAGGDNNEEYRFPTSQFEGTSRRSFASLQSHGQGTSHAVLATKRPYVPRHLPCCRDRVPQAS